MTDPDFNDVVGDGTPAGRPGPRHRADKPLSEVLVQSLIVIALGTAAVLLAVIAIVGVGRVLGM